MVPCSLPGTTCPPASCTSSGGKLPACMTSGGGSTARTLRSEAQTTAGHNQVDGTNLYYWIRPTSDQYFLQMVVTNGRCDIHVPGRMHAVLRDASFRLNGTA